MRWFITFLFIVSPFVFCVANENSPLRKNTNLFIATNYLTDSKPNFGSYYHIDEKGTLSIDQLGIIENVHLLTIDQLATSLKRKYAHLNNKNGDPQKVQLIIQPVPKFNNKELSEKQRAIIMGCVVRSGSIKIGDSGIPLEKAIELVGGTTEWGAIRRVEILRDSKVRILDLRQDKTRQG